jgi:hypothetical protein
MISQRKSFAMYAIKSTQQHANHRYNGALMNAWPNIALYERNNLNWISVKERLPEYVSIDRYAVPPWVLINIHVKPYLLEGTAFGRYQDGKWRICSNYFTPWDKSTPISEHIVTHWMPLPEIPNTKGTT